MYYILRPPNLELLSPTERLIFKTLSEKLYEINEVILTTLKHDYTLFKICYALGLQLDWYGLSEVKLDRIPAESKIWVIYKDVRIFVIAQQR